MRTDFYNQPSARRAVGSSGTGAGLLVTVITVPIQASQTSAGKSNFVSSIIHVDVDSYLRVA
jgi:hypothetical protein